MADQAPELGGMLVPIDSVALHPRNPRVGNLDAIAESLTVHGQRLPLLVQESTGFIVAGNHRWKAAKRLGWEQIAVVRMAMSDDEAERFMAADNRTSDLGTYDQEALGALLSGLAAMDGGLAGTGYADEDLTALLAAVETDDGRGVRRAPTYSDLQEAYEQSGSRSVLLDYSLDQHRLVSEAFAGFQAEWGVGTNSDVLVRLLERRTGEQAPPNA